MEGRTQDVAIQEGDRRKPGQRRETNRQRKAQKTTSDDPGGTGKKKTGDRDEAILVGEVLLVPHALCVEVASEAV